MGMDGLLNFSVAFVLVALAVLLLMGKADHMMGKYKPAFKDGKLKFVKYRDYDAKRARPVVALILLLVALFVVLEYVLRPLPEWCALILLAVVAPFAFYMEFKCRKKE